MEREVSKPIYKIGIILDKFTYIKLLMLCEERNINTDNCCSKHDVINLLLDYIEDNSK